MTGDRWIPGNGRADDAVDELRRSNPVDIEALPSSRSPEAMRMLERMLDSVDDDEPEAPTPAPPTPPAS